MEILLCIRLILELGQSWQIARLLDHSTPSNSHINPLAPEFSFKFYHTLYLKCEYYRNQKR